MEAIFLVSSVVTPFIVLFILLSNTGNFAWSAIAAIVVYCSNRLYKKIGYGKMTLINVVVVLAIFAGLNVRIELLNDLHKKEVARQKADAVKKEKEAEQAEHEAKLVEKEALLQKKRNLVKDFALKETPLTWEAIQSLESECEAVKAQVAELKKTLESFNKNAEEDDDFIATRQRLRDMNQARDMLWKAMERAYIQYCKFKASAGDAELAEFSRNATAAAIKEAGAAKERYRTMTQEE